MKAICDTAYGPDVAVTAVLLCEAWTDAAPVSTHCHVSDAPSQAYTPGQFYLRELPHLLAALASFDVTPAGIMVDGYVWLDGAGRKGLGAHLYDQFVGKVPVIGVAKHPFRGADSAIEVIRGRSKRPLYVTAAGLPTESAASLVEAMSGPHRLPDLVKQTDQLARTEQRAWLRRQGS